MKKIKKGQRVTLMSIEEIINSNDAKVRKNYDEWWGTIFGISLGTWSRIRAAAFNIVVDCVGFFSDVAEVESDYYGTWYIPVVLLRKKEA